MQTMPSITASTALFLDFDGTLVDIAPRPDDVVVLPGTIDALRALHDRLGGALAVVSGRDIATLDDFLEPLRLPGAGEHGAQMRMADGRIVRSPVPDLEIALRAAHRLAVLHPELLVEEKSAAVAVHYRQAPQLQSLCLDTLTEAVSRSPGTELLRGKCVFEVKTRGIDKGNAVTAFMAQAPFAGRIALFAGDDLTDEDGFAAVQRIGGHGLKIGDGPTQARYRCASPQALRAWLAQAAAGLAPATGPGVAA